jgi:hypothetical protein
MVKEVVVPSGSNFLFSLLGWITFCGQGMAKTWKDAMGYSYGSYVVASR